MPKGTSAELFVKIPQIAEEVTEGTPPSNATFTNIGAVMSLSIKKDGDWEDIAQLGKEDLIALIKGLQTYETQVKLAIINTNFVKRLVNAANFASPSGTISAPFTLVYSIYLDGVENYIISTGSMVKDGDFSREAGKADEWSVTMIHTKINLPATSHGLTNPTFDGPPSGAVMSSYSGGANPVSWGGTALNCKKISVKFNRGTKEDHTIGNPDPFGKLPHGRRVTFNFDTIWTNTSLETDRDNGTERTLAIVLKSGSDTMTIPSSVITDYERDAGAGDDTMIVEKCSGKTFGNVIIA